MEDNKLKTMPIARLLADMSLPMMVSFFIQALYNIVDSMFVAGISEDALTAVSLAFPMQQIANAIAVGIGVGISALVPRFAAVNDLKTANDCAHTGIFLNLVFFALFLLLGISAVSPLYHLLTTNQTIISLGVEYLRIVWCISLGVFTGQYFEKMLVCCGHSVLAMVAQASGAIFNIVFDPILIFGWGPFPQMGIAGAAWATVSGQIVAALIAMSLNIHYNPWIQLKWNEIRYRSQMAKEIFRIGIPSMITIGLNSLTSFCVNLIFLGYSTTATAVYGIWLKVQGFCFMPLFGMNNGMVPILSYNHECGQHQRVRETISLALMTSVGLMCLFMIGLEWAPDGILYLFSASRHMLSIGVPALRICCLSLPFAAVAIIRSTAMQALKHARFTLIINILRQFVLIVGSFLILSFLFKDVHWLWWAVPITEFCSFVIAGILHRKMDLDLHEDY